MSKTKIKLPLLFLYIVTLDYNEKFHIFCHRITVNLRKIPRSIYSNLNCYLNIFEAMDTNDIFSVHFSINAEDILADYEERAEHGSTEQ